MSVHAIRDRPNRRAHGLRDRRRSEGRPDRASAITRSALIADFLAVCALDPAVETLRAADAESTFDLGDGPVAHAPEFEVVREDGVELVDVVADADLGLHPLRAAALGELYSLEGKRFRIETAMSVRVEPRFTTVRLILACRRTLVGAGDRVRILHHLDEGGMLRLVDCAAAAQTAADGVAAVLALACEGLVAVDIHRPILPETPVRRRRLPYTDPFGF